MAIQVRDSAEFRRLIKTMAHELVDANIFFRLHTGLLKRSAEYADAMNESWTFWDRTINAPKDKDIAIGWYRKAAAQGHADAIKMLNELQVMDVQTKEASPLAENN
jgi:TPR repeat protein